MEGEEFECLYSGWLEKQGGTFQGTAVMLPPHLLHIHIHTLACWLPAAGPASPMHTDTDAPCSPQANSLCVYPHALAGWKRRFFELRPGVLTYKRRETGGASVGQVSTLARAVQVIAKQARHKGGRGSGTNGGVQHATVLDS